MIQYQAVQQDPRSYIKSQNWQRINSIHQSLYCRVFYTRYCNLLRVISSLHDEGVWADNKDFDEVLISKCMLQDHMPDNVLDALEKVNFNQKQKYEIVLKMFRVS